MTQWILISDASRGRIFSTTGPSRRLLLGSDLDNPAGRAKVSEIVSDGHGRYADNGGRRGTPSATAPQTSVHMQEEERFARRLADILQKGMEQKRYDSLAIFAPPQFLGVLRSVLSPEVHKRVVATVAKDLTHVREHDLPASVAEAFPPGAAA